MKNQTETIVATFTLEVNETVKKQVQIALPHYRIDNCHAYKVIDKEYCLQVCHGSDSFTIGLCYAGLPFSTSIKSIECTEAEFIEKYNEVKAKLDNLINPL